MKQFFSISNKDWFESTAPDQDILLLVIYLTGDDLGLNLSFSQGKKNIPYHPVVCFHSVVFSFSFLRMVLHLTQNNYHAFHKQQR